MQKFYSFIGAIAMLGFSACETASFSTENDAVSTESHVVSEAQALESLANALAVIDGPGTRASGNPRTVQCVTPVLRPGSARSTTRSLDSQDKIAYIVQFDEGEGSAILAADDRLEPVIAIYDTHKASEIDLIMEVNTPENWRNEENLYVEEDDEYLLGATDSEIPLKDLPSVDQQIISDYLKATDYGGAVYDVEGEWELADYVRPMLTTKWHQDWPFNDLTPGHYPAGCVAIAVAQIMAYHEYPRDYCNWPLVKKYEQMLEQGNTSANINFGLACSELAVMAVRIGQGCNMSYNYFFSKQSFTTPKKAKQFLRNIGYYGTKREIGYDSGLIVSKLKAGCPVFIGAMTDNWRGHAWVIDGYATYVRTVDTYCASNLIDTKVQKRLLLHCNWGWSGRHNGYFANGAFDALKGRVMEDNEIDFSKTRSNDSRNYTWWFRIVTYNKP